MVCIKLPWLFLLLALFGDAVVLLALAGAVEAGRAAGVLAVTSVCIWAAVAPALASVGQPPMTVLH